MRGAATFFACATVSIASLISLLIYCFFGNWVTSYNEELAQFIYNELEWYRASYKIKKHLVIIMMISQKRFYMSGYGLLNASLENFMAVSLFIGILNLHLYLSILQLMRSAMTFLTFLISFA